MKRVPFTALLAVSLAFAFSGSAADVGGAPRGKSVDRPASRPAATSARVVYTPSRPPAAKNNSDTNGGGPGHDGGDEGGPYKCPGFWRQGVCYKP